MIRERASTRHTLPCLLAIGLIVGLLTTAPSVLAGSDPAQTSANVMIEIPLQAQQDHADGQTLRVPAFWAGGRQWKVRYASALLGLHRYRSECNNPAEKGLHGVEGVVEIKPYTGKNPLYVHGPLRVAAAHRHLEHADGTPFFWLGDTWWMGLTHRLRWPGEFQQLTADRQAKGFNVIQIVAGLYPDMHPFDPRGANEAGLPWEKDYARIRPEYWDAADARLGYLVDQGMTPCVVGAWGYFLPWMGVEKMERHWRYLIARYAAWPMVWCVAGEANLPWYLAKGFPYDDRQQVRGWTDVMRYVRKTDPFRHPVTIHPTAIKFYTARHAVDDASLLDFDLLQTPHGQHEAAPVTLKAVRDAYAARPAMPVIDGEASYEMLGDSLPTLWTRRMFWLCVMNGAAGHTYGANGIWQCNRKGEPHGASPHGGTYGKITWDEAMRLPGSRQEGLGKKLFEQYPWQRFTPHPEWAAYAGEAATPDCDRPQATGIADAVRIIYVPESKPIVVRSLGADAAYVATYFDPVAGGKTHLGAIQADAAGSWNCPPPECSGSDWVLILESKTSTGSQAQ